MSRRICSGLKRRSAALEADENRTEFSFENVEENEIMTAIKGLSEKYRTAVMLFYFEEMSVREIAAVLKTGESTVRSRLSRARKALRKALDGSRGSSLFEDDASSEGSSFEEVENSDT